jgi:nitronate monooxygenase
MFGIRHPIIQGGMHFVGRAELASAVSNAGGLGIITGLTQKTPELLAKEIARCHDMTDKPFGVNLTFLPSFASPPYPEYIASIVEGGVKIVETAGRSPEQYMPALKARHQGHPQMHVSAPFAQGRADRLRRRQRRRLRMRRPSRRGRIPNMILLPRAADELKIPFVASGGMADARSLVASLALGADGMNMGTRFIATKEAPVHDNVKQAILAASELDTRLIMHALRNTERVLKNAAVDRIITIERDKGAALKIEDIKEEVGGLYGRIMIDGDMDAGAWSCGMVAGLIDDIPTCAELIERIMAEAERLIRGRLERLLGGGEAARTAAAKVA